MQVTQPQNGPRILGLCSGAGHLDRAVESVTGGRLVAYAEKMDAASKVMARHWPGVPNLGDVLAADWDQVRELYKPDIVSAGFPCTNISNAGDRTGIEGDESRVWYGVAEAVGVIRPQLVFLENVSAIRVRGLDVVAGDLATLGYDLRWVCVRASEMGAPHPRDRWFAVARPH